MLAGGITILILVYYCKFPGGKKVWLERKKMIEEYQKLNPQAKK